ncbi:unnamed protein product, partial [Sphenostylis stenocarpa]
PIATAQFFLGFVKLPRAHHIGNWGTVSDWTHARAHHKTVTLLLQEDLARCLQIHYCNTAEANKFLFSEKQCTIFNWFKRLIRLWNSAPFRTKTSIRLAWKYEFARGYGGYTYNFEITLSK